VIGKKHLREFLSHKPEGKLFAFGLNNLATACWWDLHPNYHYYNPQDLYEDEVEDMAEFSELAKKLRENDFQLVLPLYKNS
jgi:hypothetical protein